MGMWTVLEVVLVGAMFMYGSVSIFLLHFVLRIFLNYHFHRHMLKESYA